MTPTLHPDLAALIAAAAADANRRRHRHITLEHLLLVMVRAEESAVVLRACGADPTELERELEEYLELIEAQRTSPAIFDRGAEETLRRAMMRALAAGRPELRVWQALVEIPVAKESYAAMLIHAAGIERLDLLRYVSHGAMRPEAAMPPSAARLHLRLHNDNYTTMEFVVEVLGKILDLPADQAQETMLAIHQSDSALVSTLPRDEALERVAQIRELAEAAGYPLRCSLEPA